MESNLFQKSDLIPIYGLYTAAKRHGRGEASFIFNRDRKERTKYNNKSETVACLLQVYNVAIISGAIVGIKEGLESLLK